jgi:hypothetical protein
MRSNRREADYENLTRELRNLQRDIQNLQIRNRIFNNSLRELQQSSEYRNNLRRQIYINLERQEMLLSDFNINTESSDDDIDSEIESPIPFYRFSNMSPPSSLHTFNKVITKNVIELKIPLIKEVCSICLEKCSTETLFTDCNHTFHKKCLTQWLKIKNTCPNCRNTIFFK